VAVAPVHGQVSVTTGSYSQNFGTTAFATWTDNSTFPGWYAMYHNTAVSGGILTQNVTAAAPSNTGSLYSYQCNGDGNIKLGSRASNTVPGAVGTSIKYGVVLRNMSGQAFASVRIAYTGLRWPTP
jgi:hypothetical protein